MTVTLGWGLAAALFLLVALAVTASWIGRLRLERQQAWAAVRAVVERPGLTVGIDDLLGI